MMLQGILSAVEKFPQRIRRIVSAAPYHRPQESTYQVLIRASDVESNDGENFFGANREPRLFNIVGTNTIGTSAVERNHSLDEGNGEKLHQYRFAIRAAHPCRHCENANTPFGKLQEGFLLMEAQNLLFGIYMPNASVRLYIPGQTPLEGIPVHVEFWPNGEATAEEAACCEPNYGNGMVLCRA